MAAGTVAELRGLLRARGLPTGGKKAELVARLARADAQPGAAEAGPAAAGPDVGGTVGTLAEAQKLIAELRSLNAEQRALNAGFHKVVAACTDVIHVATEQGELDVLRHLVAAGDDVNARRA